MFFRFLFAIGVALFFSLATTPQATAQVTRTAIPIRNSVISSRSTAGGRVASLRDQLRAGLKVRRSVEFQFVENVAKLVDQGKLSTQMVLETFHYARRKPRGYPFQFFQRALAIRAARVGVTIQLV